MSAYEFRIKELLAQRRDANGRRLNMTSLALALGEPYGSVAGVVYGHKVMPRLRAKIAAFLGLSVEELFGENGGGQVGASPALIDEAAIDG